MRDTIEMAREVNATAYTSRHYPDRTTYTFGPEQLKAFAALVRADERDLCAQVVEEYPHWLGMTAKAEIANAIRNRGNT